MNIKILLLLLFLATILLFFSFLFFSNKSSKQGSQSLSIPTFSTASPSSFPTGTTSAQTIQQQQDAWAHDQNQYNQQNPWHSKLPLKSNDYFISYDPTNDRFIATIYYSSSSSLPTDQQIANSKAEALSAIKNLDPSLTSKPVNFIPTLLSSGQ